MPEIVQKSGVLPWEKSNIDSVPTEKGVYVLRNIPTINGIIFISYANNLRQALKERIELGDIPDVSWFDWYQIDTEEAALDITASWIAKYNPKYNLG